MKLYRGYKTEPTFLTEDLVRELNDLQKLFDEDKLPKNSIGRFKELRVIAQEQFFTDSEQIAREFAGEQGYLLRIDIDSETAFKHYRGEQAMSPKNELRYSSNFVFSGPELANMLQCGKIAIISLEKEREMKTNLTKMPIR